MDAVKCELCSHEDASHVVGLTVPITAFDDAEDTWQCGPLCLALVRAIVKDCPQAEPLTAEQADDCDDPVLCIRSGQESERWRICVEHADSIVVLGEPCG